MILEDTLLTKSEYIKHAAGIAEKHRMGSCAFRSLPDPSECSDIIAATYARISKADMSESAGMHSIPPDEWIGDNYHLIAEAAAQTEKFEKKGGKSLCKVYELASEIVSHTDGNVSEAEIIDFISSYEKVRPLEAKELGWICSMLRLALLKRLSEICEISDSIYSGRIQCMRIYREYLSYTREIENSHELIRSADILFKNEDMLTPVFAETVLRLSSAQDSESGSAALRSALSRKLTAKGTTVEELIAREHDVRISLGISAGNAIKSLQALSSLDWDSITSELCVTEQILRRDPAGIFCKMTPRSRGEYVRLARVCARRRGESPEEFALSVVEAAEKGSDECSRHVGTYIYNEYTKKNDFGSFRLMLIFITLIFAFCPVLYTIKECALSSVLTVITAVILSVLILIICLGLALSIAQNMYMDRKVPFSLPELDFKGRLPEDCTVMIVLPCLLSSEKHADEIIRQIEAAWWANRQSGIYFTILADLPESSTGTRPEDREICSYARLKTEQLNNKISAYISADASSGSQINQSGVNQNGEYKLFNIMIRERTFYEKDNKWMGYERKRGALIELNRAVIDGTLPRVSYVLTVDEGTVIPINTAVSMAQIMHHPLNRPVVSYVSSEPVVTKGYGILQPAVSPSGLGREKATLFEKIYSDDSGYDSYQCRTSDFYFDICHEGIYTGKGMYDPYVFNGILDGRFKSGSILSHDLIEGSFLRTAFVSDIHLYDSYPKGLAGFAARQHRWLRGDWQLLPFMKKRFTDEKGIMRPNPLNGYSLFKMRMNILRGIMPCAVLLLFTLGILVFRSLAFLWVLILVAFLLLSAGGGLGVRIARAFFDMLFIPYTAYYHADAAVRALWRTFKSGSHMLDWVVSADADRSIKNTPSYYCKLMWPCFAFAALLGPFLYGIPSILWLIAPYAAFFISRPRKNTCKEYKLDNVSRRSFRILARKIWAFYDDFAGEDENFLPPDNVQFAPVYCVAHRTSPTNIGFLIISTVTALRMGYISEGEMLRRIASIMDTLDKLDKWNGHIFNWYDTTTLTPLEPRYVSSVDSGNLCACLLASAAVLLKYSERMQNAADCGEEKIYTRACGLLDTLYCLNELAKAEYRADAGLLENYIEKRGGDKELYSIVKYYIDNIHPVPDESADAYSFRLKVISESEKLMEMLDGAEEWGSGSTIKELSLRMVKMALSMDFSVLYSRRRRQLHIGFNVSEGALSPSYYDMLMSEARLTSYIAMAKGDIGEEHFSALARRWNESGTLLLSWSGTVFEYILPELFMPSPFGSALLCSVRKMLDVEIKNAGKDGPWGVSESGYNVPDVNMNYKYKAFGLRELAVKRIQSSERVIAPYASVMSCAHVPDAVLKNMDSLCKAGAVGRYGLYEAVDYTPGRAGVVQSFMAHHLGMSLCGISNLLLDGELSNAFSEMPMMMAVKVMLTEKMPKKRRVSRSEALQSRLRARASSHGGRKSSADENTPSCSVISGPEAEVLSNGNYSVVLSGSGQGYSCLGDLGLDVRREGILPAGTVLYMNGKMLSPVKCEQSPGRVEYTYYTEKADITQSVCVLQNENAELRMIRISNTSGSSAICNITAYCELMLAKQSAYEAHPSYSGMFVTTRAYTDIKDMPVVLTAARRRHSPKDTAPIGYFALRVPEKYTRCVENVMYDTDILSFKGRNAGVSEPSAFEGAGAGNDVLMGMNVGAVLNPCFAVNARVRVEAGGSAYIEFIIGMENKNINVCEMLERIGESERAFELARTRNIIENEHISLKEGDTAYFRSFSSKLLYGRRQYGEDKRKRLWGFGISGDNPIITVMLRHIENADRLEKLVKMWCFYSFRGIKIDMVLAVFDNSDYISPVRELADTLASRAMWGYFTVRGDIFVIVPKDSDSAAPLIECANVVFWL